MNRSKIKLPVRKEEKHVFPELQRKINKILDKINN